MAGLLFGLSPAMDLRKHAASASGGGLQSDITAAAAPPKQSSALPAGFTALVTTLVDASLRQYQPPRLSSAPLAQTPLGYARYGLQAAWIAQFIDNPPWLEQADILTLADGWIEQSKALAPAAGDAARQFADTLRARPFDHARTLKAAGVLIRGVIGGGSQERGRQITAAMVSAQLSYNAAVLRDPAPARMLLAALQKMDELDAALPDFRILRATAAAVRPDDWEAQFKLGNALVADISATGASPAP
jgi:hypothetical protein